MSVTVDCWKPDFENEREVVAVGEVLDGVGSLGGCGGGFHVGRLVGDRHLNTVDRRTRGIRNRSNDGTRSRVLRVQAEPRCQEECQGDEAEEVAAEAAIQHGVPPK